MNCNRQLLVTFTKGRILISLKATAHYPIFCQQTKKLHLLASVQWIQTSLRQDRGLLGDIWQWWTSKRLVGPCRLVCGGPRQFVGARSYLDQWGIVMRVTWTRVFFNKVEIDSAESLNAVSHNKKSGSVRQADVLTNFNQISPDKKYAVLQQKTSSCAAA